MFHFELQIAILWHLFSPFFLFLCIHGYRYAHGYQYQCGYTYHTPILVLCVEPLKSELYHSWFFTFEYINISKNRCRFFHNLWHNDRTWKIWHCFNTVICLLVISTNICFLKLTWSPNSTFANTVFFSNDAESNLTSLLICLFILLQSALISKFSSLSSNCYYNRVQRIVL